MHATRLYIVSRLLCGIIYVDTHKMIRHIRGASDLYCISVDLEEIADVCDHRDIFMQRGAIF